MTTSSQRNSARSRRTALLTAVVLAVPLAVAGLFAGSLADASAGEAAVPAAIVNNDELVEQRNEDGTTTPVLAGRLLVTELTSDDAAGGIQWRITNEEKAQAALDRGEVYAVLTIPEDFSQSIVSLSTDDPKQAQLAVKTDDTHGYLAGQITDAAGSGLAAVFGDQLSEQFIAGLFSGFGTVGSSLGEAAEGAAELAGGTRELGSGLDQLAEGAAASATGAADAADGADRLAGGVREYAGGVDRLASGLATLRDSSAGLQSLPQGVRDYTGGVAQSSAALDQVLASPGVAVLDPQTRAALEQIAGGLRGLSASGENLVVGAQGAADVQTAIGSTAGGAVQLSAGSSGLVSGADSLAIGLDSLATGLDSLAGGIGGAADGAEQLADGGDELATGLQTGADEVPEYSEQDIERIAGVASSPVDLAGSRLRELDSLAQAMSSLLVPVGLWLGALAIFLAFAGPAKRLLASSASTGRITLHAFGRAALYAVAQAIPLVALLHLALGVELALLPATFGFSLLIAVSFTAIHLALTTAFGRGGLILSVVLLALQLTAVGGLYPIEIVSAPFQAISPLLPLTGAVAGMQAILSGAGAGFVVGGALQLAGYAVASLAVAALVTAARRGDRALELVAIGG
jgi:putative membrane protein